MDLIEFKSELESKKIIAIARGINSEDALKLAEALYEGGITFLEFPFNMRDVDSDETDKCIAAVAEGMKDKMYVGSGTTSYPELVERAYKAGATFIISADMNPDVIKKTKELGIVSIPGVMTPSEVMQATAVGADYVKLFPANNLGLPYLKALKGPYPHIKYMAVGGVGLNNIASFIEAGCVGVGVGDSLVNRDMVSNGEFDKITALAKAYVDAVS